MANSNYKLRFTNLDIPSLKQGFIDYLKTTSEFQNFNPNASGMATLLDMLAYNSYYQALIANMQLNETFLDTATKRQNVVSRSTELGYTPRSKTAPKATIRVTVSGVPGNPSTLVLPAGSSFSSSVNNNTYNFVTIVPYSASIQFDIGNNPFYQFTVDVYEGLNSQNTFVLGADPSIDIPNMDLDTHTLRVFVTMDVTEYEFFPPSNFLTITSSNLVYFLTEGFNAYKIGFGDNVFGSQPAVGSQIRVTYLLTSGADANGASVFNFTSSIPGATSASVSVATVNVASGGAAAEDINSIKANSVNYFATQDRAVTSNDFKSLIMRASTNIKDVLVWGGQDNVPPLFGKVVACVLPNYGDSLTTSEQTNIQTVIKSKAVPNIGVVFTTPSYLNVVVDCIITYDNSVITSSVFDLESLVKTTIANYVQANLSMFNGKLRYSNLVTAIDRSDSSILNNITELSLKKKYTPILQQNTSVVFSFNNSLNNNNKAYTIKSTLFYIPGFASGVWIEDDTKGNLNLFYSKNGIKTYASYNIGTINYVTGDVQISSIFITGIDGLTIDFIASPSETDLQSMNSTIIRIDPQDINVTTIVN